MMWLAKPEGRKNLIKLQYEEVKMNFVIEEQKLRATDPADGKKAPRERRKIVGNWY